MSSNGELLQPILLAACWEYRNCRQCGRKRREIYSFVPLSLAASPKLSYRALKNGRQKAKFRFGNFLSHCL